VSVWPQPQRVFAGRGRLCCSRRRTNVGSPRFNHADEDAFWWYALAWWTLTEGLEGEDQSSSVETIPFQDGSSYWIVVSGCSWGGLAGGADHEVWRWDGRQAEFIETYCVDTY